MSLLLLFIIKITIWDCYWNTLWYLCQTNGYTVYNVHCWWKWENETVRVIELPLPFHETCVSKIVQAITSKTEPLSTSEWVLFFPLLTNYLWLKSNEIRWIRQRSRAIFKTSFDNRRWIWRQWCKKSWLCSFPDVIVLSFWYWQWLYILRLCLGRI